MSETDKFYTLFAQKHPEISKLGTTIQKIVELRGWQPALPLIQPNFERILSELRVFYIPKPMPPGPMLVFPIRDIDGTYPYAQTKPLPGSPCEFNSGGIPMKYCRIGRMEPVGPQWLGNSPEMLQRIILLRMVLLVEGPFDLLACRLLMPEAPVLTPLTKRMGEEHEAYLRMLGITRLYLMYDNEATGKGQASMDYQAKTLTFVPVQKMYCPERVEDPSFALKKLRTAEDLQKRLRAAFSQR
jgi:hypothetical protein